MVRIVLIVVMSFVSLIGFSQTQNGSRKSISVMLTDFENNDGVVYISLYSNKESFKVRKALVRKVVKVTDTVKVEFKNLPKGTYAIACFHDANNNKMMDFYDNGMPKENYALSNNNLYYGPPTFDDAKFELKEDVILDLKLF